MPGSISKFDNKTYLAWQDTAKCLNGVDESYDILKKKIIGRTKSFCFSSIPPGNALHITVGRFIFISGYDRKEPANFQFTFPSPRPGARASVGILNDARTDGLLAQSRDSPV